MQFVTPTWSPACAQVLRPWLAEVGVACARFRDELLGAALGLLLAAPPSLLRPQVPSLF